MHLPHIDNIEAKVGAAVTWFSYQLVIPHETLLLKLNPLLGGIIHALISLLLPLASFILINVYKELLKDKESWVFKTQCKVVKFFSFKWVVKLFTKKQE